MGLRCALVLAMLAMLAALSIAMFLGWQQSRKLRVCFEGVDRYRATPTASCAMRVMDECDDRFPGRSRQCARGARDAFRPEPAKPGCWRRVRRAGPPRGGSSPDAPDPVVP
jgi:hypothetical protein